ncbi:MAG TPA: L,D-transpeptidase [Anaerolineaceae bacterium]|nr:L,D-transpeptidase [Anaerolineaceae bacterium]
MKRLLTVLTAIVVISLVSAAIPTKVQAQSSDPTEPYPGLPLCAPDAYLSSPADCLALGPSKVLTDLANLGLSLPPKPLPAYSPDPALVQLNLKYALVSIPTGEQASIYPSLADAVAGQNPNSALGPGEEFYVSYTQGADVNGGHYLLTNLGWIRASPAEYSTFQGLLFQQTPANSFGWIVDNAQPHIAPAEEAPANGATLPLYTVVQIYQTQQAEGTTWYMIGLNQWVDQHYIRQVSIESKPPAGVDNNRWIEIDVDPFGQTLSVYDKGQLVFATLIGSGRGPSFYTRPGLFKIYEKKMTDTMTGSFQKDKLDFYSLADVPWTMYYDESRALHGAYWHARWGYVISHGCVNMSVGDAHWLFNWAHVGDWVYVFDPSGQTPTDPSLYGPGAP